MYHELCSLSATLTFVSDGAVTMRNLQSLECANLKGIIAHLWTSKSDGRPWSVDAAGGG